MQGAITSREMRTIGVDATLRERIESMLSAGVGSVVGDDDGTPPGTVMLTDVADHLPEMRAEVAGLAAPHHDWEHSDRFR